MRTLVIILSLITIQSISGQDNIAELKSFVENIEQVDSIPVGIKKAKFKTLDILQVYIELDRKIDFGYRHHRILIAHTSGWDLKLNLFSKNGILLFGWISEYNFSDNIHSDIRSLKNSTEFLDNYISQHNKYYHTKLDEKEFKEQFLTEYVVGFGCGASGKEISKESKKTLRYAKNGNKRKLNNYLTSFSPELQTLGTIGLLKIGKINSEQQQLIGHLKERNSVIFSCAGCLYGIGETFSNRIEYYEDKASR